MGSNLFQGDSFKNLKDQMLSMFFGKFLFLYQFLDEFFQELVSN